jgi:stress-induced morphogen
LGNETFSGTLTLSANTDKHSYDAITFNVTNLATNETYSNSSSYSTPDEGNYFFTLEIVSNDFSNIKLYQGSNMIIEGIRVHINTSISLHSFTEFIAIVAIVVTIILAIVGFAIERKRRKKR